MIPHNRIIATQEQKDAVARVLDSAHFLQGQEVSALEKDFRVYTGRKHAIAVSSGLDAIRIALLFRRDLTPTVPAYSCVALANAAYSFSSKLWIADCDPARHKGWTLDCDDIGPEPGKAAVVVVNNFGVQADLPKDAAYVIEDATHGFGSHKAEVTVLSLAATKLFGAAGSKGGMILTDSQEIADFCRDRRCYDDKEASGTRLNSTMSDVDAALVRPHLAKIDSVLDERHDIAHAYVMQLKDAACDNLLSLPTILNRSAWYRFVIHTAKPAALVRAALHRRGIMAERPIEWWVDGKVENPIAYKAYQHNLSLPFFLGITHEEIREVCQAVCEVLK